MLKNNACIILETTTELGNWYQEKFAYYLYFSVCNLSKGEIHLSAMLMFQCDILVIERFIL